MDIDRASFETGIPVIDRQHNAYIDMVERLILLCEGGAGAQPGPFRGKRSRSLRIGAL